MIAGSMIVYGSCVAGISLFQTVSNFWPNSHKQAPLAYQDTHLQPLMDSQNIRKDLKLIFNARMTRASGINFGSGESFIYLDKGFSPGGAFSQENDRHAYYFGLKHEIGHIKANDWLTMPLIQTIFSIAVVSILSTLACPPLAIAGMFVGIVALPILVQRYREAKADDFAIANSTIEELQGGIRFFTHLQMKKAAAGWCRFLPDMIHPSLSSRIKKLEQEIQKREQLPLPSTV